MFSPQTAGAEHIIPVPEPLLVAELTPINQVPEQLIEIVLEAEKVVPPPSIEDIIRSYDWNDEVALAVAKAESEMNPNAFNPEWHRGCQGSRGVFQMACIHHRDNPDALFDAKFNIQKAYELWQKEGFRPWSVCSNGLVNCSQ